MKKVNSSLTIFVAAAIVSVILAPSIALCQTVAINSGTIGSIGDGINSIGTETGLVGPLADPTDTAVGYPNPDPGGNGSINTQVPYLSELNPSGPFTVEFWVKPYSVPGAAGPTPVFNRTSTSPRSGWCFFQRNPADGWNFLMYNGNGSDAGVNLTGGDSSTFTWGHVVAAWDGFTASLYHNGSLVASGPCTGSFAPNQSGTLSIGTYDNGDNSFNGAVDELAIYGTALSAGQVQAHYNAAFDSGPGVYSSTVLADSPLEYLQQLDGVVSVEQKSWSGVKSLYR